MSHTGAMTNTDTISQPAAGGLSTLRIGGTLDNGATVVEAKVTDLHTSSTGQRVENGIVLATYYGEYVTWAYHAEGTRPVETFWGHYHGRDGFTAAVEDFARR